MSWSLGTGGAYGFIKSTSSTSGCSSTLSKSSSVSSLAISTKRSRTPRKRPNQSYIEAATILSTACPHVFSIKNLPKKYSASLSSISSSSLDIIPPFPALDVADFLIEEPLSEPDPSFQFKLKPINRVGPIVERGTAVREASPPRTPSGFHVDSFFDDEYGQGIDSTMGKLSMNDCDSNANSDITSNIDPFVGSPLGFGIGGKAGLGFGLGRHENGIQQALRGAQSEEWWIHTQLVQMKDIVPEFNALPSLEKKKKKTKTKKKKLVDLKDGYVVSNADSSTSITNTCILSGQAKSGLGLKLNQEEVIKAWGDRGCPFVNDSGSLESSADTTVCI